MYITNPDPKLKILDDYDFTFQNGMMMPITLDKEGGDTLEFQSIPPAVIIHLVEKTSQMDPEAKIPAEDITIFSSHLFAIHHKVREVEELTPEQKYELTRMTLQEISKTIQ